MNKKGQMFEQFGGLATGIAALAILLVVAFLIMSQGKEQAIDLVTATSVTNETITAVNATPVALLSGKCADGTLSCSFVDNNSADISTGNYTCQDSSITVTDNNVPTVGLDGAQLNVTFSCKVGDEAYNSTETLQNATDDIPTWVPIIVITFIGVILLGLVALIRRTQGR